MVIFQEDQEKEAEILEKELAALRFKRTLRTLAIVQDLADAALAINDLRGGFQFSRAPRLTVMRTMRTMFRQWSILQCMLRSLHVKLHCNSGSRVAGGGLKAGCLCSFGCQHAIDCLMVLDAWQATGVGSAAPPSCRCWVSCQPASARTRTGRADKRLQRQQAPSCADV